MANHISGINPLVLLHIIYSPGDVRTNLFLEELADAGSEDVMFLIEDLTDANIHQGVGICRVLPQGLGRLIMGDIKARCECATVLFKEKDCLYYLDMILFGIQDKKI